MQATLDKAGRLVLPKWLRDRVGLRPGPVEVDEDGNALRITAIARDDLIEQEGRLLIPASGYALDDQLVQEMRDGDQR